MALKFAPVATRSLRRTAKSATRLLSAAQHGVSGQGRQNGCYNY